VTHLQNPQALQEETRAAQFLRTLNNRINPFGWDQHDIQREKTFRDGAWNAIYPIEYDENGKGPNQYVLPLHIEDCRIHSDKRQYGFSLWI
jgi:hypothetical protein